MHHIQI